MSKERVVTKDIIAKVMELSKASFSVRDIANKLHITVGAVMRARAKSVEQPKIEREYVPSSIENKVLNLYVTGMPYSKLSVELGMTIGQVSGIIHKLKRKYPKFPKHRDVWVNISKEKSNKKESIVKIDPVVTEIVETDTYTIEPNAQVNISIMELEYDSCRYPVREEEEIIFCGVKVESAPYCEHHRSICYVKPKLLTPVPKVKPNWGYKKNG